jgi:hypothetical protein
MNKRKIQFTLIACASGLLLVWFCRAPRLDNADARYERWQRLIRRWSVALSVERRLPASLVRLFRIQKLEQKYLDEREALGETLIASGYLTNVCIVVTNAASRRTQLAASLTQAFQGTENEWEFYVRSNHEVVVTCRPQHVILCRQALQE